MAHSITEIPINPVLHPDEIIKAREIVDEHCQVEQLSELHGCFPSGV